MMQSDGPCAVWTTVIFSAYFPSFIWKKQNFWYHVRARMRAVLCV